MIESTHAMLAPHPSPTLLRAACGLLLALALGSAIATAREGRALDTAGDVGRFVSLVLDAAGNPVLAYHDLTNRDLKFLYCDDPDCAGDQSPNIRVLDSAGIVGQYNSLVLDAAGHPVISYHDAFNGALKLLRCDNPRCEGDQSRNIHVPDSTGIVGQYNSLALDAAGHPVIAYYDADKGNLKLLHCDDPGCAGDQSGNIRVLDTAGDVGLYASLALDAAGNPVVSYHDSSSGDLKLLHCIDPKCMGAVSANISVPVPKAFAWYTSLRLDAAGHPVISYQDSANGVLKLLHCDDPRCAGDESRNIAVPDRSASVGAYNSLALDAAGNPVISYYDAANGDLKLLYCDDPRCAGDQSGNIQILDGAGDVGLYSSLVLDAAGNPVVGYYDFTNGDLKVLRCPNPRCAPDGAGEEGQPARPMTHPLPQGSE